MHIQYTHTYVYLYIYIYIYIYISRDDITERYNRDKFLPNLKT